MNGQEYKRFEIDEVTIKISIAEYLHYKLLGLWSILTQQSIEKNEYGKSGHLSILNF